MRKSIDSEDFTSDHPLICVPRFLLVSLNIETILQESTIYRRRQRLSKMGGGLGLGDAYGATIERIKGQVGDKSKLGIGALMWVSHAERPLKAEELCYAQAVELGSTDFNDGSIPSASTLVSCCQGLITMDKEASTVRLIHFTLREYLSTHPDIFSRPHSTIAEICLTYLNSEQIKALSADHFPNLLEKLFLRYCSVYWAVHAKRELSESAKSLALKLLQQYDGHISTHFLLEGVPHLDLEDFGPCFPFSGLHCASFLGTVELVSALLDLECYDINVGDFGGRTALSWAAWNGNEGVVNILLGRREICPDKPDTEGRTPLSYASWGGHEGVIKILLGREDVNPNKPTNYGHTPLSYAAWGGCEGAVKVLLEQKEVDPDQPSNHGQTPLSYAAWGGRTGVVKILLRREEVNPDKADHDGRTPLWYAAWQDHERVLKILLELEEVNPDQPDNFGLTPLMSAILIPRVDVVLEWEEVNTDKPDYEGRTPFWYARQKRERVLEMLLEREEVNPNKPDNDGRTPLYYAAQGRSGRVIKVLLKWGADPTRPDKDGETPLLLAARSAGRDIVALLNEGVTHSAI